MHNLTGSVVNVGQEGFFGRHCENAVDPCLRRGSAKLELNVAHSWTMTTQKILTYVALRN